MLYAVVSPTDEILEYVVKAQVPEGTSFAAAKPRLVPVENESPPAFNALTQVCEGPVDTVEPDAVVRIWTVRDKTAPEILALRAARVEEVKTEAQARILNLFPTWKQNNMAARGLALLRILQTRDFTTDEAAESEVLDAGWAAIDAIRLQSNAIEASIPDDAGGIADFDVIQAWALA